MRGLTQGHKSGARVRRAKDTVAGNEPFGAGFDGIGGVGRADSAIDFIRRHWSGPLDPRLPRGVTWNSRAVIDACRPFERLKDFPIVARASPELRRKVAEKFAGILGKIGCG